MSLEPGTRLGRYTILAPLGSGGMGEVYRARDEKLGRDLALKILPDAVTTDPGRLLRFEQEARATGALNHPNLLTIYDMAADGAISYIAMELLEGETLRQRLSGRSLPLRSALDYAVQLAQGLAAAHEKGIVHRDLKPENVFVTRAGAVKIFDFGLAKMPTAPVAALTGEQETQLAPQTDPGTVLGTVGYMAPEQVRGAAADHRADIFALGAILYEMFSGRRAFVRDSSIETLHAILNDDPLELEADGKDLPPALTAIVAHCLEKEPAGRFQSARDLAFALQSIARPGSGSSRSLSGVGIVAPTRPRRPARPGVRLAGIALLALATFASGVAVGRWYRSPTAPLQLPIRLSLLPPTDTLSGVDLAASPDGRTIAFEGVGTSGSTQIWLYSLATGHARPLPGTDQAWAPFWSPDGRALAFFADHKLKRVDVAGGPALVLASVTDPRGGAWSANGTIVFAPNPADGLYRVAADGGPVSPLTTLATARHEISHRWPTFLPDGRHLLFLNRSANDQDRLAIYVTSLGATAQPTRLLAAMSSGVFVNGKLLFMRGDIAFVQSFDPDRLELSGDPVALVDDVWRDNDVDGRYGLTAVAGTLAYRPGHGAATHVSWFDRQGKEQGTVGPPGCYNPRLAPDERRASVMLDDAQNVSSAYVIDLLRGAWARVTASPGNERDAVWTPDGRRIAFASDRDASYDLYLKTLGEATPERLLLKTPNWKWPNSWSPRGDVLLFVEQHPGSSEDLMLLPVKDDGTPGTPYAFLATAANESSGQFSPDGRWVAYVSDKSGHDEVYLRAFPRGDSDVQVSVNGGIQPKWRGDGGQLYFIAADGRLMAAAIGTGRAGIEVGVPSALFNTRTKVGRAGESTYAATAKGDRFLLTQTDVDQRSAAITVIVGWQN